MEDPGTGADEKFITSYKLKKELLTSSIKGLVKGVNDSSHLVGALGLGYSSEAILTKSISEELKTVIVSHSASSPDLSHFPWFARTVPTDTWQGAVLAALLDHMQVKNATVVYCPDSYCTGVCTKKKCNVGAVADTASWQQVWKNM